MNATLKSSVRDGLLSAAARVGRGSGASRLCDRWNRRRGGVILAFHKISPARLEAQLDLVGRFYRFISLDELGGRLARGESASRLAAITFDDGYGPAIEAAAEVARLRGWPMTFYLPTRYLDTGEPYWFQELDALAETDGFPALTERFKSLSSPEAVDELLRKTRLALHGDESRRPDLEFTPPISWKRVRELAARPELSFEAHSIHHMALSRLDERALRRELEGCRERIEAESGRPVRHFCYPFGDPATDIGEPASRLARSLFRTATTMARGRCRPGLDLALLPRVPLYEKDSDATAELKVALAA